MRSSSDPSLHKQREQQFIEHVEKLMRDPRLRVDTTAGRRPVTAFIPSLARSDRTDDLKRQMIQANRPDRELQAQMPVGQTIELALSKKRLLFLKKQVGRVKAICISPTQELLDGKDPAPLNRNAVNDVLRKLPPPLGDAPTTLILMSTSGFTIESHELAERRADRTVILVEPNDAGGWSVVGPVETKALVDLFDPEDEAEKMSRVKQAIDEMKVDLLGSGVSVDKIASRTQLPLPMVESQLKQYAKENPGLAAKRLDGKTVLFRQGTQPMASGGDMPLIDRMKALFSRKGETEKKIAFLSERRAALSMQRDQSYEEMAVLEGRESELRQHFKEASGEITKKRITSQLLQLHKDIERRQQLQSVLNQQINVVATHLHNLELVQQGKTAKLPDSDEMASDAAAAEEVMAELEASGELAQTVGASVHGGLSAEEQALYDELERQSSGGEPLKAEAEGAPAAPPRPEQQATEPSPAPKAPQREPRRAAPEAG